MVEMIPSDLQGLTVRLIEGLRTETARHSGCPEWDRPGIARMLTEANGDPCGVIAAACLAAGDPTLAKPSAAAIAQRWHSKAPADPPPPRPIVCPTHRIQHPAISGCPSCAADAKADAEEHLPPTPPARTATPPPPDLLAEVREKLHDVKAGQRAKVEAARTGGAS